MSPHECWFWLLLAPYLWQNWGGKCILREYTFPFNGLYCPTSYGMKLSLASKVFYHTDMFLPKMKTFECRALTLTVGHEPQWDGSLHRLPGALCGGNVVPGALKCRMTDERNTAPGLHGWAEIIYVHEAMREWYQPSFSQCLLKLVVQARGSKKVERRERPVCRRESLWSRKTWATMESSRILDRWQGTS